ncbi:hypothetical protein [Haloarchaeobius amylolyticus]|uniref:hypothetical protein n=1 Tax=Haloarchaeobius amylolyticus TaxID=1198296 RepID=UPI0034A25E8B
MVVLTHLNPDHVSGLAHVADAPRILVSEEVIGTTALAVRTTHSPDSAATTGNDLLKYTVKRAHPIQDDTPVNIRAFEQGNKWGSVLCRLTGHFDRCIRF